MFSNNNYKKYLQNKNEYNILKWWGKSELFYSKSEINSKCSIIDSKKEFITGNIENRTIVFSITFDKIKKVYM